MLDDKYKFKHCERTSYIVWFLIGVFGILITLYFIKGMTWNLFGYDYMLIVVVGIIIGFLGLLYYRHKKGNSK
jgi:hypothetical protein